MTWTERPNENLTPDEIVESVISGEMTRSAETRDQSLVEVEICLEDYQSARKALRASWDRHEKAWGHEGGGVIEAEIRGTVARVLVKAVP